MTLVERLREFASTHDALDMDISATLLREAADALDASLSPQAAPAGAVEALADRVCHEEQMTIWTGEIAGRLSMGNYLRDGLTYDDVLDVHAALADEVRGIVETAFELAAPPSSGQRVDAPQAANPAQGVTEAWLVTNGPDGQCSKIVIGFDNLKREVVADVFGDPEDDSEEAQAMRDRLDTPDDWDRWSISWSFEDGYLNVQRVTDFSALTAAIGAGGQAVEAPAVKALEEAAIAGWNACRKSIYAVCEDVGEEADRIRIKGPVGTHSEEQHAKGYHAGSCYAAKSIARGFNAMEARDDDNLLAALSALTTKKEDGHGE